MGNEYGPPKPPHHQLEMRRKRLTWILAVSGLCVLFYVLGAWQSSSSPATQQQPQIYNRVGCDNTNTNNNNDNDDAATSDDKPSSSSSTSSSSSSSVNNDQQQNLDFNSHHQLEIKSSSSSSGNSGNGNTQVGDTYNFEVCNISYLEYTPCQDPERGRMFDRDLLKYRERHCPKKEELLRCLIPVPPNYKTPFKWPQSRDYAWYDNIPHKELSIEKANQNWIRVEGNRFRFPGGGTMFPRGASAYIDDIANLIPGISNGNIRTAIDTGCGVASWGAYLLKRNIIGMSFAPRDTHEAQVWFALERGVPAMIGLLGSKRLPYPARAFDMAHCSRCLIPWSLLDGMYLTEVDRVLRPGGYWILSGPPINWKTHWRGWLRTEEDLKKEQDSIETVAKSLCWNKVGEKDDLAIWQKPINHMACTQSNICPKPPSSPNAVADAAWYKDMEKCITPLPDVSNPGEVAGGMIPKWPDRAFAVPPRITNGLLNVEKFHEDNKLWKERITYYKRIASGLFSGQYRNVMDMNAYLGGFAAALIEYPVWVMNVVPTKEQQEQDQFVDTLGLIYERGFIGTYQDWCEAFSTYPRTYDVIHAARLFSMYQQRCDITYILLEMDRILRPEGIAIFRDEVEVLVKIKSITEGMRWKSRILDHESGPFNPEKILVAVKSYWTAQATPS